MKHILLHNNSNREIVIAIDEIAIIKHSTLCGSEVYVKSLGKNELIKEKPSEIYKILEDIETEG